MLSPGELVMRDLVDALIQENLFGFGEPVAGTGGWYRVGPVRLRLRDGGRLQRHRFAGGPVCGERGELTPEALLRLVATDLPNVEQVAEDLAAAVGHAGVTLSGRHGLRPRAGELLPGERLAATRNRPFHPTARAASGWTAAELAEYGPMRREPLALEWVAVPAERLRFGGGPGADDLPSLLLDEPDRHRVTERLPGGCHALPVHPWQLATVLPREFAREDVRPLGRAGRFLPTAALRTLSTVPERGRHVKLPLGIATLGATRLLPPRYLDNGERGERTLRALLDRDPALRRRVAVCAEDTWCGWAGDEFADRPGRLAAQLRCYPAAEPGTLALPMAALAAHEWDRLGPVLGGSDPVAFFGELAELFLAVALGFLRYGVLPELHGQNVVVEFHSGQPRRLVLRDHDTVRLCPAWLAAAGVPDPGYRVRPGAPQSLLLDRPEELLGYLQTLGLQVNLYGIAEALGRHFELAEDVFWDRLRESVVSVLGVLGLPGHVEDVVVAGLLQAPSWPSRQVLGPLLRQGRSGGVSMPASTGSVPNPLVER